MLTYNAGVFWNLKSKFKEVIMDNLESMDINSVIESKLLILAKNQANFIKTAKNREKQIGVVLGILDSILELTNKLYFLDTYYEIKTIEEL